MAKAMRRDYGNDYPSVTQILGILRKIGLENWFKYNTAQFCNEESSKGKEIGTQIHEAIQNHIEKEAVKIETQYSEEVMNALNSFMLFKKENRKIKLKRAEVTLTSEKHKFNGTMDCLANIGEEIVLLDWKSGKNRKDRTEPDIYDEHIYQASAYVMAYNEQEKANIRRAFIACFAKNAVSYKLLELDWQAIQDNFTQVFLPALSIRNFQKRR